MRNKNMVEDILQDTIVDGDRIYEPITDGRRVTMKNDKFKIIVLVNKLNLILNLKMLHRDDYIFCCLSKIRNVQKLFLSDI